MWSDFWICWAFVFPFTSSVNAVCLLLVFLVFWFWHLLGFFCLIENHLLVFWRPCIYFVFERCVVVVSVCLWCARHLLPLVCFFVLFFCIYCFAFCRTFNFGFVFRLEIFIVRLFASLVFFAAVMFMNKLWSPWCSQEFYITPRFLICTGSSTWRIPKLWLWWLLWLSLSVVAGSRLSCLGECFAPLAWNLPGSATSPNKGCTSEVKKIINSKILVKVDFRAPEAPFSFYLFVFSL